MSDFLWPHGLQPTWLLCSWNSPGKNTGVGSHSLLQRIFPTQGSNLGPTLQEDSLQSEPPGGLKWYTKTQVSTFAVISSPGLSSWEGIRKLPSNKGLNIHNYSLMPTVSDSVPLLFRRTVPYCDFIFQDTIYYFINLKQWNQCVLISVDIYLLFNMDSNLKKTPLRL